MADAELHRSCRLNSCCCISKWHLFIDCLAPSMFRLHIVWDTFQRIRSIPRG